MRAAILAIACAGCIPAVPFVVGETAETLQAREVSAAIYGGGGAFTGSGSSGSECCGGVMGRVRVGVGRAQEVGLDGGVYLAGHPGSGTVWGTARLGWKLQLREHYALVAGIGGSFITGIVGLGGDAGVVVSTSRLESTPLQLYAGLRATMMVATNQDIQTGGGVLSGGVMLNLSDRWRLAFEAGAVGGGGTGSADNTRLTPGWFGGYGAALVSYAWRR